MLHRTYKWFTYRCEHINFYQESNIVIQIIVLSSPFFMNRRNILRKNMKKIIEGSLTDNSVVKNTCYSHSGPHGFIIECQWSEKGVNVTIDHLLCEIISHTEVISYQELLWEQLEIRIRKQKQASNTSYWALPVQLKTGRITTIIISKWRPVNFNGQSTEDLGYTWTTESVNFLQSSILSPRINLISREAVGTEDRYSFNHKSMSVWRTRAKK